MTEREEVNTQPVSLESVTTQELTAEIESVLSAHKAAVERLEGLWKTRASDMFSDVTGRFDSQAQEYRGMLAAAVGEYEKERKKAGGGRPN